MNRVCLVGRLTSKPELNTTGSGVAFTRFTLAVNRTYSNSNGDREADFIPVVAWRKTAETICNYLNKGSQISIEGRIQTGNYQDKDGNKRYTTEVVADQFNFLESRNQSQNRSTGNFNGFEPIEPTMAAPEFDSMPSSNDITGDFGSFVSLDDDSENNFLED